MHDCQTHRHHDGCCEMHYGGHCDGGHGHGCGGHGHGHGCEGLMHGHEIHHHGYDGMKRDIVEGFANEMEYMRRDYARTHPVMFDLGSVDAATGGKIDDLFDKFTEIGVGIASYRADNVMYIQSVYNLEMSIETTKDTKRVTLVQRNVSTNKKRTYTCTETLQNGHVTRTEGWSEWSDM